MGFDDLPQDWQGPIVLLAVALFAYFVGGFTAWLLMHGRVKHHALRAVRWILEIRDPDPATPQQRT